MKVVRRKETKALAGEPFRLPARIGLAGARNGSDALVEPAVSCSTAQSGLSALAGVPPWYRVLFDEVAHGEVQARRGGVA